MASKLSTLFLFGLLGLAFLACKNDFDNPAEGQVARNIQEIDNYLIANNLATEFRATSSGMRYIIDEPSSSTVSPQTGEEVEFTYVLSYLDNTVARRVDSVTTDNALRLPIGIGVMVPGLDEGLRLMRVGERARLFLPNNLAFSDSVRANIPKYSAVIFDVRLLKSRNEAVQIQDYLRANGLRSTTDSLGSDSIRVYYTERGTGARVVSGKNVTVAITGKVLRTNKPFDVRENAIFEAGANQLGIEAIDKGVLKLRVGDRATFVFPSARGYGAQGSPNRSTGFYIVPPYSPLVYEITVKSQ
ncbi:FKBP-type peptidyl-prolyl cis-trans isomerase [Tellurirhabdus bombi]|uniref:FKBP-type peptidyl-prolyl cis-trans isomerase n=1 Tax=Tellurirhabdus bombi TaxID=2907205 RepID=UPI001F414350|nr:FKBP-type peptidyl-prolyl cis-trans isomerase [Tellurirhabdus bombi]